MATAGCSTSSSKWNCFMCTYLNYDTSQKCTVCQTPRTGGTSRPLFIEDAAASTSHYSIDEKESNEDATKWSCPACTYFNCLRTKKCVQCYTDRPLRFGSDTDINKSVKSSSNSPSPAPSSLKQNAGTIIAKALNKWTCGSCTYDNWPNAGRCIMCGVEKPRLDQEEQQQQPRISCCSAPQKSNVLPVNVQKGDVDGLAKNLSNTTISTNTSSANYTSSEHYTSALDIYLRRFAGNDFLEQLFFKAATAIASQEIQMVNSVVDYLINEGNLNRSFTCFESRLLNSRGFFRVGFETGDSLIEIAKKCDCGDLVKLMKRVSPPEDNLPCVINCSARTRVYAKIAQFMAVRNGSFNAQFVAHPYNFNIFKFPMKSTECNLEIMKALLKPLPCIPPTYIFVDCYDTLNGSTVVGRPLNFLMKNRGGANSLCDAVFQTIFGVCDRFNILRSALKYTMIRSAHFFKSRWREQRMRMARDCGLTMTEEDLNNDWNEVLNALNSEDEQEEVLEPIHVWALSHVVCRPIIVVPMNEPVEILQELDKSMESLDRQQEAELLKQQQPSKKQFHICEGIYLPVLWSSPPISRSPLVIAFRNGLFNAVLVSDGFYQRDQEVQRFLKIRRSRRHGDNLFRFLTLAELENSNFIAQFICLGVSTLESMAIRRDPHPFLYETLQFYANWVNAIHACTLDLSQGELNLSQLEQKIELTSEEVLSTHNYEKFLPIFSTKALSMLIPKPHRLNSPISPQAVSSESVILCDSLCGSEGHRRMNTSEDEEEEEEFGEDDEEEEEDNESLVEELNIESIDEGLTSTLAILRNNRKKRT